MSRFALVAALSAALIGGSAAAQTAPTTPDQSPPPVMPAPQADAAVIQALDRFDTDDDQKISLTEWTAAGRQERGYKQGTSDVTNILNCMAIKLMRAPSRHEFNEPFTREMSKGFAERAVRTTESFRHLISREAYRVQRPLPSARSGDELALD